MNDNKDPQADRYARNLTADAYPRAEEIPGVPAAFRRKWALRLGRSLPADGALEDAVKSFQQQARREIAKALGEDGDTGSTLPSVSAVRLDDHHLVLEIDCPSAAAEMGDAAAIVTWGVLRAADAHWQLEDLQGIPARYWFALK